MTTRAHGSRRYHGSKEEVDAPTCLERDRHSLRNYSPWLYAKIPSSKPGPPKPKNQQGLDKRISTWLKSNGDAPAPRIAAGLGYKDPSSVMRRLAVGVPGVEVVGDEVNARGNTVKVWGVRDDGG